MKRLPMITAAGALALLALVPSSPAGAEDKLGAGITMYFTGTRHFFH